MLIYNVTTKANWAVADAWVQWMKEEHIPAVMRTGKFVRYQFVKILEVDDADGPTFAVQYFAENQPAYQQYINNFAAGLRHEVIEKWGDTIISFRSIMEEL